MTIELQLYNCTLLVAAAVNVMMAAALWHNNFAYHDYPVYRHSRFMTALSFVVFAVGFLLHEQLQWRMSWPEGATALSVSYFHIGGVLLSWSHTSLLNPHYLKTKIVVRDIVILALGQGFLWTGACSLNGWTLDAGVAVFLTHVSALAVTFYRTYYRVRLFNYHHSFLMSCHLIILFGIGCVIMTALVPHAVWPYTVLLILGIMAFCFIFYGLSEYGAVIDASTNATEDAVNEKMRK